MHLGGVLCTPIPYFRLNCLLDASKRPKKVHSSALSGGHRVEIGLVDRKKDHSRLTLNHAFTTLSPCCVVGTQLSTYLGTFFEARERLGAEPEV